MSTHNRITRNSESGFSILELLIAALLTVGIMGAAFSLLSRNQRMFVTESSVTDMNENVRSAVDLLTRDIQSAGMGLPRINGSYAAVFYKDGTANTPDQMMLINGDPYAPAADVEARLASSSQLLLLIPPEVTMVGNAVNPSISFLGRNGISVPLYASYAANPVKYLCYDDTKSMVMTLASGGSTVGYGSTARLQVQYDDSAYSNPATMFGSPVDTGEPDYATAKVALLGSLIAYRLNPDTRELERTEDLTNWYAVARGIINLQMEYRTINRDSSGAITESVSSAPANRRTMRSVIVTVTAETPDIAPDNKNYRQVTHRFEAAPRNFNLLNNTNLSSNTKGTWVF